MEITKITSHVLQYDLLQELGYSQQYYQKRTAHLVEVETSEGVTGWGECFGPGTIALANRTIVENVIQPLILGMNPIDRDVIWHKVYNLMRILHASLMNSAALPVNSPAPSVTK